VTILSGIPVLHCQSIETTLEFYQRILHFVIVKKRNQDDKLSWVHIMHGETTLMLQAVANVSITEVSAQKKISLYFFVDNIEDLQHLIKAKNSACSEIVVSEYSMKEFTLLDPEGNNIIIGQKS